MKHLIYVNVHLMKTRRNDLNQPGSFGRFLANTAECGHLQRLIYLVKNVTSTVTFQLG